MGEENHLILKIKLPLVLQTKGPWSLPQLEISLPGIWLVQAKRSTLSFGATLPVLRAVATQSRPPGKSRMDGVGMLCPGSLFPFFTKKDGNSRPEK